MAIENIAESELSTDPRTGLVTGDADPTMTRDGVLPRFVDSDQDVRDRLDDLKTIFDGHDHDPGTGTGGGGQPLGTGGVRSFAVGAITEEKIPDQAVTNPKVGDSQITTAKILDESVPTGKIGDAGVHNLGTIAAGATAGWSPSTARVVFDLQADNGGAGWLTAWGYGTTSITVKNTHPTDPVVNAKIHWRGGA